MWCVQSPGLLCPLCGFCGVNVRSPSGSSSGSLCRRNAFGFFVLRKSTVKDACLMLWVELRSRVNSCVLGRYRSVEWCVQTLSPLEAGSAALLSWRF